MLLFGQQKLLPKASVLSDRNCGPKPVTKVGVLIINTKTEV